MLVPCEDWKGAIFNSSHESLDPSKITREHFFEVIQMWLVFEVIVFSRPPLDRRDKRWAWQLPWVLYFWCFSIRWSSIVHLLILVHGTHISPPFFSMLLQAAGCWKNSPMLHKPPCCERPGFPPRTVTFLFHTQEIPGKGTGCDLFCHGKQFQLLWEGDKEWSHRSGGS